MSVSEAILHGLGASTSGFIFKVSTRKTDPLGQPKPPEPLPAPPGAAPRPEERRLPCRQQQAERAGLTLPSEAFICGFYL